MKNMTKKEFKAILTQAFGVDYRVIPETYFVQSTLISALIVRPSIQWVLKVSVSRLEGQYTLSVKSVYTSSVVAAERYYM